MTPATLLLGAEALLVAFALGATLWFFFVQTPALLMTMGMEAFLPLQMRLVRIYGPALAVAAVGLLGATTLRMGLTPDLWASCLVAAAALFNTLVAIPRALRSGGQAYRDVRQGRGADASLGSFVSVGGGQATAVWHRVVVAVVLVMTGGLLVQGFGLLAL